MELKNYLLDGACMQARCVLCYIQDFEINESYDEKYGMNMARIEVGRWENCREQGYCVSLAAENFKQLNIAFFENRNSDELCAVEWVENTINTPTIGSKELAKVYKSKYNTQKSMPYMHIEEMGDWITGELKKWWLGNKKK